MRTDIPVIAAAAFLALFIPTDVGAHGNCASIKDAVARLACYDKAHPATKLSADEASAREVVLKYLKDPDSAKFGEFLAVPPDGACYAVNAKNSMGGYAGEKYARLKKVGTAWELQDMENYQEICVRKLKGEIKGY
jgi:hypothetical protein